MTPVLHFGDSARGQDWQKVFAAEMPEIDFRCWPDLGDAEEIRHLVAWKLTDELLTALPNLEVLFSIGAGIDQLAADRLPKHLRIVRMIEPGITQTMADYVSMAVLALHRDLPFYIAEQRAGRWSERATLLTSERRVGVMGLGELGRAALAALAPHGFRLSGWSRTTQQIGGVACFNGATGFDAFLGQCDILVCLLPLTDDTRGILCRNTFAKLPKGARLINVARGGHLVQSDLLAALDSGQLEAAILDVTDPEPLPDGHPFYRHPAIFLTPHISGVTRKETAVHVLIDNLRRELAGQPLLGEVDRTRGY
ncbi:MAG: glyoxylate/hydroxypyruvate reductase A [Novosphingobium sp.]